MTCQELRTYTNTEVAAHQSLGPAGWLGELTTADKIVDDKWKVGKLSIDAA